MPVTPDGTLTRARFVERPNRFVVHAQAGEDTLAAHCPNPGRLEEFLIEDTPYLLRKRPDASPGQTTTHSIVAAKDGRFHVDSDRELGQAPEAPDFSDGAWTVLDTQMANRLVEDALDRNALDLGGPDYQREPSFGEGRADFAIPHGEETLLVEVKSVTLIGQDGVTGLFPDAPTERGVRHVHELIERAREGQPAALVFVAMRPDAERIAPQASMDPDFANAVREAQDAGVTVQAYSLDIGKNWAFAIGDEIPVRDVDEVPVGGTLDQA
jgi:sugar fermentation stimulation protein A